MAKKRSWLNWLKPNWKFFLGGAVVLALICTLSLSFGRKPELFQPAAFPLATARFPNSKERSISATVSAQIEAKILTATAPAKPAVTQALSGPGIPILMYHYVGNNPNPQTDHQRNSLSITPEKLDAQMAWLAQSGHTPVTLDTLYAIFAKKASVPKPVVLTFDDGYVDFFINALPILRKYGFHAVAFIPTGLMDQGYYLSWGQIREIQQSGLVSFEAHSVHHYSLPGIPYNQMLGELRISKQVLEAQTGTTVNFVAYPYGAFSSLVGKAAAEAGFVGGVGTWYGKATGPSINMPRIRISGNINLSDFAAKVGG